MRSLGAWAVCLLVLLPPLAQAQAQVNSTIGQVQKVDEQVARLDDVLDLLGRGYDFNSVQRAHCVMGKILAPKPNVSDPQFYVHIVRSSDEFERETQFEASVSGGFAGWRANASTSIKGSLSQSQSLEFLLVKETVLLKPRINLHDAYLDPRYKAVAASEQRFYETCGANYVAHVQMGGELVAVLQFSTASKEAQREIEVQFGASGPGFESSAEFKDRIRAVSKYSSLSANITRLGTGVSLPQTDLQGLLTASEELPSQVMTTSGGEIVSFELEKYDNVPSEVAGGSLPAFGDARLVLSQLDADIQLASDGQAYAQFFSRAWHAKVDNYQISPKHTEDDEKFFGKDGSLRKLMNQWDAAANFMSKDLKLVMEIRKACADAPWSDDACDVPDRYRHYRLPHLPEPLMNPFTGRVEEQAAAPQLLPDD